MAGTRWVQTELLEKNPKADVRVLAVWFNMFPSDHRGRWPEKLLTDKRVTHFWDEEKRVGKFYLRHFDLEAGESPLDPEDDALWDAYILYDKGARWENSLVEEVSWGYTIVRSREQLERDLLRLLTAKAPVATRQRRLRRAR